MGKLNDSLLSGSSGRTGRLVVANVSGTEILRVRPRKRTTQPTAKQLLIQLRFKKCTDFIMPYRGYASAHFGMRTGMRSSYNLAFSSLTQAFKLDYVTDTVTVTYPEIEFSRGPLMAAIPTALTSAGGKFEVQWTDNSGSDAALQASNLQLLYAAEGDSKPVFLENSGQRVDALKEVTLSPALVGKTVHVWLAFRSPDNLTVSVSSYAGSVVIA